MELNKIYNICCLEFMKTLPDKCIDLCLTDPPYGIGADMEKEHNGWKDYGQKGWDTDRPSKEIFDEIFRISKNQVIWGGNYFIDYLYPTMCWLVWDKGQREFSLADGELAWTSFDKAMRIFTYSRGAFLGNEKFDRVHPTQKPVKLSEWILEKYAKEGDIIFDPFAGSGTFLVSAQNLGFNYIGCELDKDYFEIAEKRLGFIKQRLF